MKPATEPAIGTALESVVAGLRTMVAVVVALPAMLLLAACASQPLPAPPEPLTRATPEAMVAAIRASAGDDDTELAVKPLRDPMVDDLREDALRLESRQQYAQAAAALDQALSIVPDDPALLQERAEAAVLQGDFDRAEALARHAFEIGSRVGPLCRRHWSTVRQVRLEAGDAAGAVAAQTQLEACRVAGPNRF